MKDNLVLHMTVLKLFFIGRENRGWHYTLKRMALGDILGKRVKLGKFRNVRFGWEISYRRLFTDLFWTRLHTFLDAKRPWQHTSREKSVDDNQWWIRILLIQRLCVNILARANTGHGIVLSFIFIGKEGAWWITRYLVEIKMWKNM